MSELARIEAVGAASILLTPRIKRTLLAHAQDRQRHKTAASSRKKDTGWSDLALHYLGLKGEYVIAEATNLPFTPEVYGAHGDDGVDVRVDCVPCAIKTRHLASGDHVVERRSDLSAVSHVLFVRGPCTKQRCGCRICEVETPECWTYCGWLTVDDFWAQCTEDDWGHGPRWWVSQRQLIETVFDGVRPVSKIF